MIWQNSYLIQTKDKTFWNCNRKRYYRLPKPTLWNNMIAQLKKNNNKKTIDSAAKSEFTERSYDIWVKKVGMRFIRIAAFNQFHTDTAFFLCTATKKHLSGFFEFPFEGFITASYHLIYVGCQWREGNCRCWKNERNLKSATIKKPF